MNVLSYAGRQYLVAPRGVTQWVKNLRAIGEGELKLGRQVERFRATEIADEAKTDVLRAYLRRWKAEVGVFFGGVGAGSSDADIRRIAPNHPVFLVERIAGTQTRSAATSSTREPVERPKPPRAER